MDDNKRRFLWIFLFLLLINSSLVSADEVSKNEKSSSSSSTSSSSTSTTTTAATSSTTTTTTLKPAANGADTVPKVINTNTPATTAKTVPTNSSVPIAVIPSPTPTVPNCVCDGALLPRVENGKEVEICPHCRCKYEKSNTTLIKVVVIIVIWIISILVIYMLFLMCLDPLLNKRVKANYQEHTNEDDDTTSVTPPISSPTIGQELSARANVLNRVGHQQTKWKKQVREQRRNIYDRRTMLN